MKYPEHVASHDLVILEMKETQIKRYETQNIKENFGNIYEISQTIKETLFVLILGKEKVNQKAFNEHCSRNYGRHSRKFHQNEKCDWVNIRRAHAKSQRILKEVRGIYQDLEMI